MPYRDVGKGDAGLGHLLELGLGLAEVHGAAAAHATHAAHAAATGTALAALCAAEEEEEAGEGDEGEEDVAEEGDVVALLVAL